MNETRKDSARTPLMPVAGQVPESGGESDEEFTPGPSAQADASGGRSIKLPHAASRTR